MVEEFIVIVGLLLFLHDDGIGTNMNHIYLTAGTI